MKAVSQVIYLKGSLMIKYISEKYLVPIFKELAWVSLR